MGIAAISLFFAYIFLFYILQGTVSKRTNVTLVKGDDPKLRWMFIIISLGFLCYAEPGLRNQHSPNYTLVRSIGLFLLIGGFILSIQAQKALGANWMGTVGLRSYHSLITHGPYRYIRHPMYVGIAISQIGISLFSMNRWMAFACFFFTLSFMVRVPEEEQLLSNHFGRKFAKYREETGLFLPRLLRHR